MENEINLDDLDKIEASSEKNLQVKDRFAKLSEKMTLSVKEKEEAEAKTKVETDARLKAEKERDFFREFSQISSKYPNASQYQDQILEKVNVGYTAEDAALSILAKEGKLQPITAEVSRPQVLGGSSSTAITDLGDKNPEDMSQDERRSALLELEKQGLNLLKF